MPTITAQSIISKAQILAQDTTGVRWPASEWLGWLNDAQREIAIARPNSFTKIASVPLVAGTKQSIPSDGIMFIEYYRAMGAAGTTPGSSARKVDRRLLDSQIPSWHTATATAAPQHYIFDPLAPKTFYVYPPSTGGVQAEILYSASPTDVAAAANTISLDDIYATVILDYLLYRAYSKDSEFVGNAERALVYRKAFEGAIGLKTTADNTAVAKENIKG